MCLSLSSVGDEGGFAPNIQDNKEGLLLLREAIEKAGVVEQDAERQYLEITRKIVYRDEKTGSELIALPDDDYSLNVENLPMAQPEPTQSVPTTKAAANPLQNDLFNGGAE